MAALPQLLEEDIAELNDALHDLLLKSESSAAVLIDKGGFVITTTGDCANLDTMTLSALAAASFAATQSLADILGETNFSSVYQQGEKVSMLVINVDPSCLLTVVFKASVSVGAVKYFSRNTITKVVEQLKISRERDPEIKIDLSMLNLADPSIVFKKKGKKVA